MILDYSIWKEEVERFSVEEFGSINKTKDYSVSQKKLDEHMDLFSRKFAEGNANKIKEVIKLNREYMQRYTRELRS